MPYVTKKYINEVINIGSLNFKELKIDNLLKPNSINSFIFNKFKSITLKRDGCELYYKDGDLISSRGIVRNNRFPHILAILRKFQFPNLIGEMYIEGGRVFDITSSKNWNRAKFMPFEILNNMGLSSKLNLLKELVGVANSEHITPLIPFDNIREGWDFVEGYNQEGLVCRNNFGDFYKVKKQVEFKGKILRHEKGSDKGCFIVDVDGTECRVSGTSLGYVNQYEALKEKSDVMIEGECSFFTEAKKPFQPRLRRIFAET